jgi:antitoxin YefM
MYNIVVQHGRKPMAIHTTYSQARQNLSKLLDDITKNHETVVIKRRRGDSVVMMSEKDAVSLFETSYLLRSPRNAMRLLSSLERALARENGVRITIEDIKKLRDEVAGGRKKP